MKRSAPWFAACLTLCLCGVASADEPNKLSLNEEISGWKLLFDGKTTNGWRNYKKDTINPGWIVEDGCLIRKEKGAGDILTTDEYENFELLLDFKISPEGNSGLMFHVNESEKKGPPYTGPEIQIQDNVAGHDPQKAGWLYQLYQPKKHRLKDEILDATRPAGEWNEIYLRVTGDVSEVMINGVQYYTFKKGSPEWDQRVAASKFKEFPNFGKYTKGFIALQDHGNEVAFRNIKVREIKGDQSGPSISTGTLPLKPVVAFPDLKLEGWQGEDAQGRSEAFRPIVVTAPKDGSNRLFVAEQHGAIWSFDNKPDATASKLVLDIRDRVSYNDKQNEEGLLGFTFHPKFKENGYIYVYYTPKSTLQTNVSRFSLSKTDPTRFDPASEKLLFTLKQPYWNHNGGTIVFGPDGYLYIALGDGGAGDDPHDNGQNLGVLLGKILRIDVDKEVDGKAYSIPADNPFVNTPGAAPEIYAYGFRNPWRIAFDSKTGHLWCADVGQNLWEEIDIVTKGGNYGWRRFEGTHPFGDKGMPESEQIFPIFEYDHQVGKSITGGFVYRGTALPDLVGKYVYADYVTGKLWALDYDEAAKKVLSNATIPGQKMPVLSFGDDAENELYFCIVAPDARGIYKIIKK